jgi:hypothetical protein
MTEAHGPDRRQHDPIDPVDNAARPGRSGQKRGRALVPATIIGIIVVVFAVILGVSQCAAPNDQNEGAGPAPAVVSLDTPAEE